MQEIKLGLFGYGIVGHGVRDIIVSTKKLSVSIEKICVKHKEKSRDISMDNFTFNKYDILNNPNINLIVEVIDDAKAAYEIVTEALKKGKNVISANKKMIAENLEELMLLQFETGAHLLYEASTGGSIPIIRNLEEYYDNDLLSSVHGILNSSTNYVLSRLFADNMDYDIAIKQAQDLGYAESNPNLDIWGYDALYKLIIISAHAYGVFPKPTEVFNHGIQNISTFDIQFAKEKSCRIKQIATVKKIDDETVCLFVMPQFTNEDDSLSYVHNEYNGLYVEAAFSDKQFFQGNGAGAYPTGSCVISDISANSYNYKYEYKKYLQNKNFIKYSSDLTIEIYLRYYSKKNLALFDFEEVTAKYESEEYNYVIGKINLQNLVENKDKINKADVLVISTGKYF